MTFRELKKQYKGYSVVAFGVPLKDMQHCTPFTRLPRDKDINDCEVVEYEVEEKEYTQYGWQFPTMKPTKPEKIKGNVYCYLR